MTKLAAGILLLLTVPVFAQWPPHISKKAPLTPDGKVDLKASTPRTSYGTPDLSGLWEQYSEAMMPKYLINLASDLAPQEAPLQPGGEKILAQRQATNSVDHPGARCLPSGIPEKDAVPAPFKIIQNEDLMVMLYESRTIFRQVFTDGRALPDDPDPAWQGYSIGHWEGDTMVVETRGFKDDGWLDMAGHPASSDLHVIERFTRKNYGSMTIDITIDDAKMYTKPWVIHEAAHLLPTDEIIEHICEENNKDPQHMSGK